MLCIFWSRSLTLLPQEMPKITKILDYSVRFLGFGPKGGRTTDDDEYDDDDDDD